MNTASDEQAGTETSQQEDNAGNETTDDTGTTETGNVPDPDEGGPESDSENTNNDESEEQTETPATPSNTCVTTDVGIAFQAVNATLISDADNGPANLIDRCTNTGCSGDSGTIVTLDAGAVHQMQGIYVWSTFSRLEWIRIESSADGVNWTVDWTAAPTKPVAGPTFYGLATAGATRYVRV